MRLLELAGQFYADLMKQRLRTALTIFGITWGTVAVVVLLAFGVGIEEATRRNARGIGDNIMILFSGRTTRAFDGFSEGRIIRYREEDARLLGAEVRGIGRISPEYGGRPATARRGSRTATPYITGVEPVYAEMRNILVEPGGRFLNEPDLARRRRVVVLGDEVKLALFGDSPAVGEAVYVGDVPFRVIGVLEPKIQNSSYNSRDQDRIFIPASTYRAVFGGTFVNNIVLQPMDPDLAPAIRDGIYQVMSRKYRFDPADRSALSIWDTSETEAFFKYLFLGFNIFMGAVGAMTLAVGGIGVANIMYVVVRERTREIGVKRSLGARRRDILLQFLAETFVVVSLGALLGFVVASGITAAGALLPGQEFIGRPRMSPGVVAITMALLTAIAFLAGWFPARKAAHLDPVECLRQ